MSKLLIALLATLAGCAGSQPVQLVSGNERGAYVRWGAMPVGSGGQLQMADAHCQKFGRHAVYNREMPGMTSSYNCVE